MAPASCDTPSELSALGQPLRHLANALSGPDDVTIVAIGSSSTGGDGRNQQGGILSQLIECRSD
jgi:hypothetical protein